MKKWRDYAKCKGADPRKYDTASLKGTPKERERQAEALCEGCPVIKQCAADAIAPMYAADGVRLYTSGVVRAGEIT